MAERTYHSPRAGSKPRHPLTHDNHPSDGEWRQDCERCDWLRARPGSPETVYYLTIIRDLTEKREDLLRELGVHRRPRAPRPSAQPDNTEHSV